VSVLVGVGAVGVRVGVRVEVGVGVDVRVRVAAGVRVKVAVGVAVAVGAVPSEEMSSTLAVPLLNPKPTRHIYTGPDNWLAVNEAFKVSCCQPAAVLLAA